MNIFQVGFDIIYDACAINGFVELSREARLAPHLCTYSVVNLTFSFCNSLLMIAAKNSTMFSASQTHKIAISIVSAFGAAFGAAYMARLVGRKFESPSLMFQNLKYLIGLGVGLNLMSHFRKDRIYGNVLMHQPLLS